MEDHWGGKEQQHSFSLFFRPHPFLFVRSWHLWMECSCWLVGGATDAHFLVETTGCWFTSAPSVWTRIGGSYGIPLTREFTGFCRGSQLGPCSLFLQTCHKRDVRVGQIWPSCMVRSGLWGHSFISEVNVNKADLWGQEVGEVDLEMFCIKLYVWGRGCLIEITLPGCWKLKINP